MIELKFNTNNEAIIELCKQYWQIDSELNFIHTVSSLAKKYALSSNDVSKKVKQSCIAFFTEDRCFQCESPHPYKSRSDFQKWVKYKTKTRLCDDCITKEHEAERRKHLEILEQRKKYISEEFALKEYELIDLNALSFDSAIYLLTFIRALGSENFITYGPLNTANIQIAPREDFCYEIIKHLYRNRFIVVHPSSPVDAFEFKDDGQLLLILNKIVWTLSIGKNIDDIKNIFFELERIFREKYWPDHWQYQYLSLWQKVALEECLEYLNLVLTEHGLPFTPGDKTRSVLTNLLEEYSVGQVYNLIWSAGKDAAAFYLREKVSKTHAANTVVGNIQRRGERARAEGWSVKAFRRDWRCPESIISQVLFNTALQIGEAGFSTKPCLLDVL